MQTSERTTLVFMIGLATAVVGSLSWARAKHSGCCRELIDNSGERTRADLVNTSFALHVPGSNTRRAACIGAVQIVDYEVRTRGVLASSRGKGLEVVMPVLRDSS